MMSLPIGLLYLLGARIRIDSHPHFRISICYTVKNHWGKIQVSIAGLDAEANVNKNNKPLAAAISIGSDKCMAAVYRLSMLLIYNEN